MKRQSRASFLIPICDRIKETLSLPNTPEKKEFDVFISYRRSDSHVLAEQIFQALTRTRHPQYRRALKVFLDDTHLKIGQNIHVRLQTAIKSSASFIILLSPTYNKTEYTTFEQMLIAGEDWGGLQERIIPILVQECEIPERLRVLKYLDLRPVFLQGASHLTKLEIPLIRTYCIRVPQEQFADCLAAHLHLHKVCKFRFVEELGDIVPHGSYLELADGTRISFSFFDIRAAISIACDRTVGSLIEDGFIVTDFGAKTSTDFYGQDSALSLSEPILIFLEKLTSNLTTVSPRDIMFALEDYAFQLPLEFDRSHLNSLPHPSPSLKLLHELINREEYYDLKECLVGVASVTHGIAEMWAAEIVRYRSRITDEKMLKDLDASRPSNPEHIKIWAQQLLKQWIEQ